MMVSLLFSLAAAEPAGLDAVQHTLSLRHPVPCEQLLAQTDTPVETLLHVVDHTTMPPWAPMRAAECLMEAHASEIQPRLDSWVTTPELKGLGRLTLGKLDHLPLAVAEAVGRKALTEGTEPERARRALVASSRAELRALVPAEVAP